jgi:signal transduction histidine kinase
VKFKLILLYCLILSFYEANASKSDTIFVENEFEYLELGQSLEYTSSKENYINIKDLVNDKVEFKKNDAQLLILNEDEYLDDLWIKIVISNKSNTDRRLYLYLDNALINYVEYYEYEGKEQLGHQLTGDAFPISERLIQYRNPIYNIKVAYNQTKTIYLLFKLKGRKIHTPLQLYSQDKLIEHISKKESKISFYYGILAALSVLSLMFFFLIKENVYIYFASYLTSQTLLQLATSGFAAIYIWPDYTFWADRSVPILMSLTIISGLSFLLAFVDHDRINKWLVVLIRVYQVLAVFVILGTLFEGNIYYASIWLLYRMIPPFYIGLIILALHFFAKNYLPARFFLLGIIGSFISIFAIMFYSIMREHNNVFTNEYVLFGEVLNSTMLTLALLDRFRYYKEEKDKIQLQMIEQLEELNKYRENINRDLSEKISEKTKELNQKQYEVKRALLLGEEQERKRIATELHDGMGSLLSTLKLNAESIELNEKQLNDKQIAAYKNVIDLIDKSCIELRNISHNMIPTGIEQFGLIQSLQLIFKKINNSGKTIFYLDTYNLNERFNRELELSLYRITLELINNIIKHSNAKNATIQLIKNDDSITLMVVDDGIGFDSNKIKEGMGLHNIKSRVDVFNGKLTIDTQPERCSTFIIEINIYEKDFL